MGLFTLIWAVLIIGLCVCVCFGFMLFTLCSFSLWFVGLNVWFIAVGCSWFLVDFLLKLCGSDSLVVGFVGLFLWFNGIVYGVCCFVF